MSDVDRSGPRHRRPAMLAPVEAEAVPGDLDPALRSRIAHETAQLVAGAGRQARRDPRVVDRLAQLLQDEGVEAVAQLWAHSPARSLPGALWRLFLLGEWVRRDPRGVAARYERGMRSAEAADVVAGVERPPGPDEVREMTRRVLHGTVVADLGDQLDRAAAFYAVCAAGGVLEADDELDAAAARDLTRRSGSLLDVARDLSAAARAWRAGTLD